MRISEPSPGLTAKLLASENLQDWVQVDEITLGDETEFQLVDIDAALYSRRFYKIEI